MEPRRIFLYALIAFTVITGVGLVLPALNPQTQQGLPALSQSLQSVTPVAQRQRVLGYERAQFGNGWARAPESTCTMREASIIQQVTPAPTDAPTPDDGPGATGSPDACEPSSGTLYDPYSQQHLELASPDTRLEVDHVFPLSAAWDLGAYSWDATTRHKFANDPLNLVVTARAHNQDKSDQLPAQWMPPHRGSHCWYGTRLAAVAAKYELQLPQRDIREMKMACRFAFGPNNG